MAVEAVSQAAEFHSVDISSIRSFELKDVLLSAALLVPDDDRGLELLTNLRPEPDNTTGSRAQWGFTVTSVINTGNDDVFTEHCSGKIAYSFEPQGYFTLHHLSLATADPSRFRRPSQFRLGVGPETGLIYTMV